MMTTRYAHTNLIARDWRTLADFYIALFGCTPVPPERDQGGEVMERGTGLRGAHLCGVHLRLPGYGDAGPTLEVYTYTELADGNPSAVNRPGYGHLAFGVDDVADMRARVLEAGGRAIGEIVTTSTTTGAQVMWCYVTDPEGNIIELQAWL
jgi:predicted enzyme related to lactoylglutathione lyase